MRRKIIYILACFSLVLNSLLLPIQIFAEEVTIVEEATDPSPEPALSFEPSPTPSIEPTRSPSPEPSISPESPPGSFPEPSPGPTPEPTPASTPQPLWTENDGVYTTQILQLGVTYRFPPNENVSLTFTKLPEVSGTVTVRENEVPPTVDDAGSKDYEITSTMPNGSFSFDLTLPTNDPNKEVLASDDGQNYDPVSNETITSSDTITIKDINHLTHFIVADPDTDDYNHPVINEFFVDGTSEWIELYNPTDGEIDLSDWVLDDNGGSPTTYTFGTDPGPATISAKGFLVISDNFGLNDTSPFDTVRLINPSSEVIDSRGYISDPGISSIGRTVDGGSNWTTFSTPTQGVSNGTTLDTLYVDDDWTNSSNDGDHTWGFDAFASIQDAIDFAPEGSTINVASGTYSLDQTLVVEKSLTFSGPGINDSNNLATIDGQCNNIFDISANDVTISGFDLTDESCNSATVIRISGADNTTIDNNIIRDGYTGIEIYGYSDPNNPSENNAISNNQIDNNEYGIYLSGDVSGTSITNNSINQNSSGYGAIYSDSGDLTFTTLEITNNSQITDSSGYGIYFDWFSGALTISGNDVSDNYYEGIYLYAENSTVTIDQNTIESNGTNEGYSGLTINQAINSNITIQNNIAVSGNGQYGIYLSSVDGDSSATISGNTIQSNSSAGIYLDNSVTNTTITENTITDNGTESLSTGIAVNYASGNEAHENIISGNGSVGVENTDSENFFDARENFWGDETGPYNETSNPDGLGNSVGDNVFYRPFYTDSEKTTPSTFEVSGTDFNPSSLFTTGLFSLPDGTTDQTSTPSVTVNEEFTISVASGDGTSSVLLPAGNTITKVGGGNLDSTLLSSSDVDPDDLSGFTSGTVIDGAMQWGIPNLGLEFSQAITLNIFVGTSLNGQTLDVRRSITPTGPWVSDGIEPPATCLVASGLCTFQATKASYYATTRTVSTPSTTSDGGGGSLSAAGAPSCNDAKPGSAPTLISAVAGANSVTLTWTKATGPATYYLVNYSTTPGIFQFGNPNVGGPDTTSYTVSGLSGGTTYHFKVRAGNGCMPGDYSNEVVATPSGGFISGPAAGFIPGVLGAKETVEKEQVKGEGAAADLQPSPTTYPITPNPLTTLLEVMGGLLAGIAGFLSRLFGR